MGHHTQEVVNEAARIQTEVDKIFETARWLRPGLRLRITGV